MVCIKYYYLSLVLFSLSTLNDLTNVASLSLFKSLASIWDDAQWAIQDPTKSDADILCEWHAITPRNNSIKIITV